MKSLHLKSGDCITIGDDISVQVFQESGADFRVMVTAPRMPAVKRGSHPANPETSLSYSAITEVSGDGLMMELKQLAREIAECIPSPETDDCKDMIGAFVAELMTSVAHREIRESRRKRQREAIDAAKKRGVQFGRQVRALPDDFEAAHKAWRNGETTLQKAADTCGMAKSSFYDAVLRVEKSAGQTAG